MWISFTLVTRRTSATWRPPLQPHQPYPRGVPPGLPFRWDERTIQAGLNFTLTTSLGDLDLLGEVAGGGFYEQLLPFTQELDTFGVQMPFRDIGETHPTPARRGARPKDLEAIAELQALLEERAQQRRFFLNGFCSPCPGHAVIRIAESFVSRNMTGKPEGSADGQQRDSARIRGVQEANRYVCRAGAGRNGFSDSSPITWSRTTMTCVASLAVSSSSSFGRCIPSRMC